MLWLSALMVCALALTAPIWRGGFWASHELLSYPYRVWELDRCLRGGVLYPRWFPDFAAGYGYPFLNFYAPATFYLAEVFHAAGLGVWLALKVTTCLIFCLAAAGAYVLCRKEAGPRGGFVAGVLYATCAYLVNDVFLRGDLAEGLAMGLLAWGLVAIRRIAGGERGGVLLAGVALAGLMLSHNITAMLGLPLIAVYGVWVGGARPQRVLRVAGAVVLGLGLTTFFWLPAVAERHLTWVEVLTKGYYGVVSNLAKGRSLLALTGEPVAPVTGKDIYFVLGPVLALMVLSVPLLWGAGERESRRDAWFASLLAVGGVVLGTQMAAPLWKAVAPLRYVQFPWRLLLFASLGGAWLAALAIRRLETGAVPRWAVLWFCAATAVAAAPSLIVLSVGKGSMYSVGRLVVVVVAGGALMVAAWQASRGRRFLLGGPLVAIAALLGYAVSLPGVHQAVVVPRMLSLGSYQQYEGRSGFVGTTILAEYTPRWAPLGLLRTRSQTLETPPRAEVALLGSEVNRAEWLVRMREAGMVEYGVYYYPGWRAAVDGKDVRVKPSKGGLIQLEVPEGEHKVTIRFGTTPLRVAGGLISLLSLGAGLLAGHLGRRKAQGQSSRGARKQQAQGNED